jgi:hypothetical protein
MVVAFPGTVGAGLAAGVADLDAGHGTGGLDGLHDRHEGLRQLVRPDAGAARRDAAFGRHGGGFHDHQAGAAAGDAGVVRQMPFVGLAVHRHVLAHGRDGDAVAQGQVLELEGVKRADMDGFLSMMKMKSTSTALAQHSLRLFVNIRTMEGV